MDAKERFMNDPVFHNLVTTLEKAIEDLQLSPSEIRDAAMLACIRFEDRRTHPAFTIGPQDKQEFCKQHRHDWSCFDVGSKLGKGHLSDVLPHHRY